MSLIHILAVGLAATITVGVVMAVASFGAGAVSAGANAAANVGSQTARTVADTAKTAGQVASGAAAVAKGADVYKRQALMNRRNESADMLTNYVRKMQDSKMAISEKIRGT